MTRALEVKLQDMLEFSWDSAKFSRELSGIDWLLRFNAIVFPLLTWVERRLVWTDGETEI